MRNFDLLFRNFNFTKNILLILIVLFITTAGQTDNDYKKYQAAVADSEVVTPAKISRNLIAIVESNEYLKWKIINGKKKVLVATWVPGADKNLIGQTFPIGQTPPAKQVA